MPARTWPPCPGPRASCAARARDIAILAFGTLLYPALQAAEQLGATVANMRFVKPLDTELVERLARGHGLLVTVEDGCVMGGAGSAVIEHLLAHGLNVPVLQLGLPDQFIEHGEPAKLMAQLGLDAAGIERSIRAAPGLAGAAAARRQRLIEGILQIACRIEARPHVMLPS